jgi:fumarate hydratase, class II
MTGRIERDSMGEMEVPEQALYGASTQRAVLNFPISGLVFSRSFIAALGAIKASAAQANQELGLLDAEKARVVIEAAEEVEKGELDNHFVVDIFQTGSGTSTNMNANEVIANRAAEKLGKEKGSREAVHPNDHVNMCQSSNDVIPTAIHVSALQQVCSELLPAMEHLVQALTKKSVEFDGIIKSGRTHLQDATPVRLGQEFGGYARQISLGSKRVRSALETVSEVALGGTAVGTGVNTHPQFAQKAIHFLNKRTGLEFIEAESHFEAQGAQDAIVELSGQLRTVACSLMKIANDVRWLSSGPRCGIGELQLPAVQPGSSIMPAKVNPVICESVLMVCAQVIGNDACIATAGQHGNFELNVMLPVIAYNILQSITLLANSSRNFADKCIEGLRADEEKCLEYAEKSLAICTSLAPHVGYDKAAAVAKRALKENKTVREVATAEKLLNPEELERVLNLKSMTEPGL